MNDVFSVRRFSKYLLFDLNNAKNKFGLSLLITGLCAIIIFVISTLFSLLDGNTMQDPGWINFTSSILATAIITIVYPVKVYGGLTDKKEGSSWLMVPASGLEKFLSMSIIVCIILPLCLYILLILGNLVVSLFAQDYAVIPQISALFMKDNEVLENGGLLAWLIWSENILAFTLGAICFKTGKTGKTILCYFAFGLLVMFLMMLVFGKLEITGGLAGELLDNMDARKAQDLVNMAINACNAFAMCGLLAGIYFRIKTLKH